MAQLPYLFFRVTVNLLIQSIIGPRWHEDQWGIVKPQLRRALEIRSELSRDRAWN